jgi:hypothetical protein
MEDVMISDQAMLALAELEAGARMNCLHTIARELIAAGLAFDGWGKLEISEEGRRLLRKRVIKVELPHTFEVESEHVANLQPPAAGSRNVPRMRSAWMPGEIISHQAIEAADQVDRNKPTLAPQVEAMGIAWSRSRAIKAAGEANGRSGLWVDEKWVACFLEAYEAIG